MIREICFIALLLMSTGWTNALQSATKEQIQLIRQITERLSIPDTEENDFPRDSLWPLNRTTDRGALVAPTLSKHLFDHHNGGLVLGSMHTRMECPGRQEFAEFPAGGHVAMAQIIGRIAYWLITNPYYINGTSVKRDGNLECYYISVQKYQQRPFVYDQKGRQKTNRREAKYLVICVNRGQTLPCTVFLV